MQQVKIMKRLGFKVTAACLAGIIGTLATTVRAADPESFEIAGVLSFSGPFGIVGESMKRGVDLAIEQRGGKVLGKPVRVSWEDDETKPQTAVQKASRLLASGSHMVFGAVSSASTLALQSLADQRKVPLLVTISADDKITSRNGSRYTFRTSNSLGMEIGMMLAFTKAQNLKRVYGVVNDYQATRDGWETFKAEAEKAGIQIVGADFAAIGTRDFSIIIDKIAKSNADSVALITGGSDSVTFLKQSGQVNLGKSKVQFGPVLQDELLAAAVGPASVGVYSGVRYHFSFDNPTNRKFVEAYRAKYNEWPSSFAGEAYDGMAWWLDVVEGTKSWDTEKWVEAFAKSTRLDSIEGTKVMRSCDHQASQVGLWGVVMEGKAPLPAYTMKITNVFAPEALFAPCL